MAGTIRRTQYLEMLHRGRGVTDVVKVVTGMRRSGKSTLLEQYASDLLESGVPKDAIVSINFEDFEGRKIRNCEDLDAFVRKTIRSDRITHLFLDEIQNVEGWEKTVASALNTKRCDLYITGSNSKMLSSELSTHIAGRYVEVKMLPLSFKEYLEMHPSSDREGRFGEYLRFGSLPEVDPSRGERFCDSQLEGIFNTVLVNDVLGRMGSSDSGKLKDIARFLYSNVGNLTNVDTVAKAAGVGNVTAGRYMRGLEEALLIYGAERYDIAGKRLLKTNGKYYASDLGMRNFALRGVGGTDISRPLENIVFLELVRRGYLVRVGSFRDSEVDFTAFMDGRTEYYQVTLTMMADETRARELRPLNGIRDNYRKTVLTMDRLGLGSENGIDIVNVLDWLAGRQ
ncbi:MAG: ATP-binding protein [Candidatus Methanoplasma sp.]|jgi:predicted AAA+ superfamily ATPase|nr:ATP-binding protein [Candidatus Methanoplasma sp.]